MCKQECGENVHSIKGKSKFKSRKCKKKQQKVSQESITIRGNTYDDKAKL